MHRMNDLWLDFVDENGNDVSTDEDRMFVELNGFSYKDRTGKRIVIDRCWYEDVITDCAGESWAAHPICRAKAAAKHLLQPISCARNFMDLTD